MFGFDDAQKDYNKVYESDNQAEFSHELVAGAGSFMAFKAFEDHQRKEGSFTLNISLLSCPPRLTLTPHRQTRLPRLCKGTPRRLCRR